MANCQYIHRCGFFNAELGYSPELIRKMRARFCLTSNIGCVRLVALEHLPLEEIPDDLMPTDAERLNDLVAEYAKRSGRSRD